jgi:hypothetical protein
MITALDETQANEERLKARLAAQEMRVAEAQGAAAEQGPASWTSPHLYATPLSKRFRDKQPGGRRGWRSGWVIAAAS